MAVEIKILGRHVLNPRPDLRRSARNFNAVALWPAGTVFLVADERVVVEWSPGGRFHCVEVSGAQAQLLRVHLRPVMPRDAVAAIVDEAPRWALGALDGEAAELGRLLAAALRRAR